MSTNSTQPPSQDVSSEYSYVTTNQEIQIIDFKINTHNGSTVDLITLANSVHALVRNQGILVNSINTLFQNQRIMMDAIVEFREWKMKCSTSTMNSDSSEEEETHLPQMPLTNLEEFLSFDRELQKSEILRKKFVKKISGIRDSTFDRTIKIIMKSIMTDELCVQITWTGVRKSVSMNDKKIPELIFSAIHKEPSFSNYKLKNVENVVKVWLQQAKTRFRLEETKKVQKALEYEKNLLREKALLETDSKDVKNSNLHLNKI